jgi:DNA-binding CsgD family transcriptional regulator
MIMLESFATPLRHAAVPPVPVPLSSARLQGGALGTFNARGPVHAPASIAGALLGAERDALAPLARCMAHMLDEIDYGMLLVDSDAQVLYLNHAARRELDSDHPLQLAGQVLVAPNAGDATVLQDALAEAQRGKRRLMTLGSGEQFVGISVVPLNEPDGRGGATLLVLGKRSVCEQLSVQGYARAVSLTPAETRVLELLCGGVQPTVIAARQGVAVSTVRTQIGSIRAKTGANSIRELVRQVAVLPPLVGALRSSATFGAVRMPLAS